MHISQDEKEAFRTDNMPLQNTISFLEHLEQCPYCMEQFLQNQAAEETPAPAYLRQQILEKSASPGIRMKRTAYHVSKRMQIALCGIQTAAGVFMALFLLFAMGHTDMDTLSQKQIQKQQHFSSISRQLNQEFQKKTQEITNYINQLFYN
ncbi:MAG: hypothetical protein SPE99_01670 [Blautia sp.]|nr:hypothetical protein [Blautia sp.]